MKNDMSKKFSIIDEGFTVDGTVTGKVRLVIKGTVKGAVNGDNVGVRRLPHPGTRRSRVRRASSAYPPIR